MSTNQSVRGADLRYYAGFTFRNAPDDDGKEQIEQNLQNATVSKAGGRTVSPGGSLRSDVSLPVAHAEVTDDYALAVFETSTSQPTPGFSAFRKSVRKAVVGWHRENGPIDKSTVASGSLESGVLPSTTLTDGSADAGLQVVRDRLEADAGDDVDVPETPLYHTFVPERPLTDRETAILEQWSERIVGFQSPRYRIVDVDVSATGVVVYLAPTFVNLRKRQKLEKADRLLGKIDGGRAPNGEALENPEFWGERELGGVGELTEAGRDRVGERLDELANRRGLEDDVGTGVAEA